MEFLKIPGINGLGHTSFAKEPADLLMPGIPEIKLNHDDIREQKEQIYKAAKTLKEKTLIIGGDHSISYPLGLAFIEKHQNPGLIIFDAHADCMPPLTEPTHEEWLSALLDKHNIPTLIIGLRKIEIQEKEFIKSKDIITITPEQISSNPSKIIDQIKSFSQNKEIYISFDIDALDPSIAPATHYLEKSGLSLEQAEQCIKAIPKAQIKLIDLVEIHTNHSQDDLQTTLDSAKQIISFFKQ